MNKKFAELNKLPRINHWFNNFFWYQWKPIDEREQQIFLKIYEKSFFTLGLQLMIVTSIFFIFRLALTTKLNTLENYTSIPYILLLAPIIMFITYYQGYKLLKKESISYTKRKAGWIMWMGNISIMIFVYIITYWLLNLSAALFNIFR